MAHVTFSNVCRIPAFVLCGCFAFVVLAPSAYAGFEWVPPTQSAQDPNPVVPVPQVTPMLPDPQPQQEVFMPMEPAQAAPTPTTMNRIVREPIVVAPAPAPRSNVQMPRYERHSDPYTPNRTENTYSARNQNTYVPQPAPSYEPVGRVATTPAPMAPAAPRAGINPYPAVSGAAPVNARTSDIYAPPSLPQQQNNASYAEVVGFGEDVPLALALSQIVPPEYSYSFSPSVNLGKKVSWDGGKPWDAVLQDMIAPLGYGLSIEGSAVKITDHPTSYKTSAIISPPETAVEASADIDVAALLAAPSSAAKPAPAQPYSNSVMASAAPTTIGTPIGGLPGEQSFADIAPAAGEEINVSPIERAPVVIADTPSTAPITPTEESVANALQALEPVTTPRRHRRAPAAQVGVQPDAPGLDLQAFAKAGNAESSVQATANAATWNAQAGASLKETLSRWSHQAGVELVWTASHDFTLSSDLQSNGSLKQAIGQIFAHGLKENAAPDIHFVTGLDESSRQILVRNRA